MLGERRRCARTINGLHAATAVLAPVFRGARDERLFVAHLCAGQRLIGLTIRFAERGKAVPLPIREIVGDAVRLGTRALVLAHNHPSGDPSPSATDIDSTRRLVQAIRPIEVRLRDHLVFGGDRVVSFRQSGLL